MPPEENTVQETQESTLPAQEEESGFDDAFAEFSGSEHEPQSVDKDEDLDGDETGTADQPSSEPEPETDDFWANASEAQKAALEQLERERDSWRHRYQSDSGRVSALQRKVNQYEQLLQQQAPVSQQPVEHDGAGEEDEDLAEFKNTYPEIAEVLDKYAERIKAEALNRAHVEFQPVNETLQHLTQAEMARQEERELAALEAAHPDWRDVANSVDFNDYVRDLPAQVAVLAQSENAKDVSYLLQQYKATRGNATQSAPGVPVADSSITQRRQEQLRQAAQPPASNTSGRKPVGKDDFDGAFAAFAARKTSDRRA